MARALNLRQVEIFKAVMELGTVSQAAQTLNISQPAASKLLMQLEADHSLKLFERRKGRLIPTTQSIHLYEEVERIFAGVKQVESAIDYIRREDQGRLVVGLPPALAGGFIRRVMAAFSARHPNVYCVIQSRRSRWLVEQVLTRQIDVAIAPAKIDNSGFAVERFAELPLICITSPDRPLAWLETIGPEDLADVPFVALDLDSLTGQKVDGMFRHHNVTPRITLTTDAVHSVIEFVAAGLGVSLVYPLFVYGLDDRIVARPFRAKAPLDQYLIYPREARNLPLIQDFAEIVGQVADEAMDARKPD